VDSVVYFAFSFDFEWLLVAFDYEVPEEPEPKMACGSLGVSRNSLGFASRNLE
jgi:hypothetical protein